VTILSSPATLPERALLADLDGRTAFAHVGPAWFTPVMGTGIVASAAATLPVGVPGLTTFARGVWLLDVAVLLVVLTATALHWRHHPVTARGHLDDPAVSPLYGAPAMALMTVGAGALLVGQPLLGATAALAVAGSLWVAGTLLGLWTTVAVPARLLRHPGLGRDDVNGTWLMPVVPPMVSAATGPLLVPHLPDGRWQVALVLLCAALFAVALVPSLVVVAMLWTRVARRGPGPAAAVPTLWIVLGPLGQSVTAAHHLGASGPGAAYRSLALAYGAVTLVVALGWLAVVVAATARAARTGLPFALGWWAFVFPVGTLVTGSSGLAAATGSAVLATLATTLYVALLGAWVVVGSRTVAGVRSGRLLRGPGRPA
jgi:tellurite resistance protein TehA-like permease